ncbi:MAG: OsmC family protein [Candidatus Omnitrophota bacterium]
MVEVHVLYEGGLHCKVIHGPSGKTLMTDAPKDHEGQGETFSPTDLVAAALGSCIVTVLAILAERRQLDIKGTQLSIIKEMTSEGPRRIKKLGVEVTLPKHLTQEEKALLERAALSCPVYKSLHPEVAVPVYFLYQ